MTAHIDFASLPDAEAARLMAEMDGWRVKIHNHDWYIYRPKAKDGDYCHKGYEESLVGNFFLHTQPGTNYPHSLDAAVVWLGRMGLEWMREPQQDGPTLITVYDQHHRGECKESPDCPTSRALCNAGWAAVQAREASDE